jgi:hypothetical protein
MAETSKTDLLLALWRKFQTLYDFVQELNARLSPADRPDFEPAILNAKLEIERVKDAYHMIKHGDPIPFPSEAEIKAFAIATGELQKIVKINESYQKLASAAAALVNTWPISGKN